MCPWPLLAPGCVLCPRHREASSLTFAPQTCRQLIRALVIGLSLRLTSGFTHTDCQDGLFLSRVKGGGAGAVNPRDPPMAGCLELCVTSPRGVSRAPGPPGRASFLRSPCAPDGVAVKVLGPVGTCSRQGPRQPPGRRGFPFFSWPRTWPSKKGLVLPRGWRVGVSEAHLAGGNSGEGPPTRPLISHPRPEKLPPAAGLGMWQVHLPLISPPLMTSGRCDAGSLCMGDTGVCVRQRCV